MTAARVEAEANEARGEALVLRARANVQAELANGLVRVDLDTFHQSHLPGSHIAIDRAIGELLPAEADVRAARGRLAHLAEARVGRPGKMSPCSSSNSS